MAFLTIHFSEERRQRLASILQLVSWTCVICGVALVALGIFINLHVQAKINLIEGYDSSALPKMLVIVGSFVVLLDLVCGKICQDISDHRRIHRYQMLLFPLVIVLFVLDVSVLTAGCMCFAHRSQLSHSIHNGLMTGMLRYKDNLTYKFEIDELQMEFKCCGNSAYQDWFNIQWINTKYLNINDDRIKSKMATGIYLNDDVPFSCCVTKTTRACIHHHVTDSNMHFNYQYPTELTIYPVGCRDQLIEYFSKKLKNIGTVSLAVFGLQFIIVLCLRYLQTSIANAGKTGNPKADAPGWLFDKSAGKDQEDNSGEDIAFLEAQHQQRRQDESSDQQDDYSDDFESDHFSDDDDGWGGGGGGGLNEPIYENLPLLDQFPQDNDKKSKSKKDGTNKKPDNKSKKAKGSKQKKNSKNKSESKKQQKNNKPSSTSKKPQSSPTKKSKSPTAKNKSPTSKKTKTPASKKMKSPASKKMKSPKSGASKGMKKPKKGLGKMPGKKMGRMNRNRHNNCNQSSSSSSGYTSSDGYETDLDLPVYYVNETI